MTAIRTIVLLCALVFVLVPPAGAAAGSDVRSIRITYNGPPDIEANSVHRFAQTLKELVDIRTGGGVDIALYPNSQLGDEAERMRLTTTAPLMNVASLAGMQTVFPEIFVANVPFMFRSYEAARWFFSESPFWREAQKAFHTRSGAYLVETVEDGGFLALTNDVRPIRQPSDLSGLTMRAMDEAQTRLFTALGAEARQIPWTDLHAALADGTVDGQMNPPTYIVLGRLYEVQTNVTLADIQYSPQFLVVNGAWLDALTDDQAEAVRRSAHDAAVITGIWVEAKEGEQVRALAGHGMAVYRPTADEMQAFRQVAVTAFTDWLDATFERAWIERAKESAEEANRRAEAP